MIQDIAPHRLRNAFSADRAPSAEHWLLSYRGNAVLSAAGGLRLPKVADYSAQALHYAFSLDGVPVWLTNDALPETEGWRYIESKIYRAMTPQEIAFACTVGESLHRWHCANRYCGACRTELRDSKRERALVCPTCGAVRYPRINPAVIVAVTDGDRLLLTKYADRPFSRFALVAGFCEAGESAEDTVRREVWEEVGLRVKNLLYYKSQPWAVADDLLLGFYCEVDGETTPTLRDGELKLAQWFARESIPNDYSEISLTGEMIDRFRREKTVDK
ncbi:MAG: NAD(+) diphosphatase [Oscillospiraceae bacterium]|nr:NAD(+) diphosphatase [Oscillospiraceae bacterium]